MFGLGAWEVVVILMLALIVLGPQKLPHVARQMARYLGELRRVADEVRRNFDEATREPPTAFPPPPVITQVPLEPGYTDHPPYPAPVEPPAGGSVAVAAAPEKEPHNG